MKIYKSKKEAEKDVVNGTLIINDNVTFEFNLNCKWHIIASNIKARNIEAYNINAFDIEARDINALNIKARDIYARNIEAYNIKANNIGFHAYAIAYNTFKCRSIFSKRENSSYSCLDSEVIITGKDK